MDDDEFAKHLINLLGYEQAYHFYLVSRDLKPGVMFLDLNRDLKNEIADNHPESYEIHIQESEIFKPSIFRRLGARFGWAKAGLYNVYLSPETERIKDLQKDLEAEDRNPSRAVGRFLGYPQDAIEYFNEDFSEPPVYRTRRKIHEMKEQSDLSSEDAKLIKYVEFIPSDDEDSIHQAIDRGKKFRKRLENDDSPISDLFQNRIKEEYRR